MQTTNGIENFFKIIEDIFKRNQFVEKNKPSTLNSKLALQLIIAFSFLILSVANVLAKSHWMLLLTVLGFLANALFAVLARKLKNEKLSAYSSITTCSLLFASFVVNGGNDGFACLWVVLLPLLSMVVMDFKFGLYVSIFFQFFLIVVFWTPLNRIVLYEYNEQFRLRFPLFFFVTFMLGFLLTVTLQQAEYNEYVHMRKLEEMNERAISLARIDPLTKLANRRYSYEELNRSFAESGVCHCIVMGDIDDFKQVNDLYGHEFGDEVLMTISKYITDILPDDYLKARWGGEEFLFAANASPDTVYEQVEKLRTSISVHPFLFHSTAVHVTMTFGIAMYTEIESVSHAIELADKGLYLGKSKNKNCTVIDE